MDALGLSPPAALSLEGNLAENWRRWRRNFENFLVAINSIAAPKNNDDTWPAGNTAVWARQIAILRHCIGEDAVEILDQFVFDADAEPAEDDGRLPDVLTKFEGYFNPKRNRLYEWYSFWSLTQSSGEPIDMFVKRLRTQAAKCEFGDMKDMMMLCRCAFGISDPRLKEKLLQDSDITLSRAINMIRASEVTKAQLQTLTTEKAINVVADVRPKSDSQPIPAPRKFKCKFCTYEHLRGKCPAYGKECRKCKKLNHFAKACESKEVNAVTASDSRDEHTVQMNQLFIGAVEDEDTNGNWMKEYTISHAGRSAVSKFKIDTGAEANIIPISIVKNINPMIVPSSANLTSYSGHKINNLGKTKLSLSLCGEAKGDIWFELVDRDSPPILGLAASIKLGLVKRVDTLTTESILDEFPDCFEGIGCLDREHKMVVDPEVKPVVNGARRIPLSMIDRVKAELESMEQANIISKVDQPTPWVSSMVVIEKKNGSVRICLDPRELNKAILRERHHIPTLDDIAHRFAGMKIFTILDMKHGYWHVPLDKESRLLTTFNTPFGRFAFNRLPFGVNSAAEVFEKRVEEIFGDLNAAIYFDDLVVYGKDQQEHDDNLRKLLMRARDHNVKFNKDKIQLNQSAVRYLGHIVSAEGLKADPDKVEAITSMPKPTDKQGIQRLLGSLNYLRGFIPNISQVTEPLRVLLKADAAWAWGANQDEAIERIKELLTKAPVLQYFDVRKATTLQVDSSKSGLGAVLLQDNHPIAYASRALTETEQNWPQIDKELLAIVFGFERFHSYVYGHPTDVQTDHNPLVSIIKKDLHKASPRLQRLLLRLLKYDIRRITYVPGKFLYLADTLSRAYLANEHGETEEDVVMVHTIQMQAEARDRLTIAYEMDPVMQELMRTILEGWAWSNKSSAPASLQQYWNIRDELYIRDGLVYKGEQLVIPEALRSEYLSKIHQGHLGNQKCIDRARQSVYWPHMSAEIKEAVSRCAICQRHANQQQKEPLIPHDVPELPWNKVGMDIMDFRNKSYLLVVDFHSHYPEFRLINNKKSEDVIAALKSIFAVHGVPVEVIADNMPFSSYTMKHFADEWGFNITTSSPHYPKSNGMAERYVQTVKQFMKKAEDSAGDIYAALLAYRQTPVAGLSFSPAEMLFNRNIRSTLPSTSGTLTPSVPKAFESLQARQDEQRRRHDRHAKALDPLDVGDDVLVRTNKESEWTAGQVVAHHQQPRSYVVDNGTSLLRRNRVHLKPDRGHAESPFTPPLEEDTDTNPDNGATPRIAPATPVRRSLRETRGTLPKRFDGFQME